jgi:transcription antitermination factor NusG
MKEMHRFYPCKGRGEAVSGSHMTQGYIPRVGASDNTLARLASESEARWYAVYTCARHEKKISEQLQQRSIEQFLPLYETVRRWKDRRVRLQLPLFASYVFVRISLLDQLSVLKVPGVVRIVSFNGEPVALPEVEISALQRGLSSGLRIEPYPYLAPGRLVRIKAGPLCGLMGKLVRRKENYRVVVSVDSISSSIVCEVSVEDLEAVGPSPADRESAPRSKWRDTANMGVRPVSGEVVA